jgi:surfeit locus 1 family protein
MTGAPPVPIWTRRNVVFLIISAIAAVGCLRLGLWQVDRLSARRVHNRLVASRLAQVPVPLAGMPRDTAASRYRRVKLSGTFDFDHEIVLADRVRDGAPGVNLVTPFRPDSAPGDTVVLVDRGWVYAADGMSVERGQWREPPRLVGIGYVTPLASGRGPSTLSSAAGPNEMRWLDRPSIQQQLGHPVADYMVVIQADTSSTPAGPRTDAIASGAPRPPVRVAPPPLDEGPHLSYAIQWFSFALIAIVGPAWALFIGPRLQQSGFDHETRGQLPPV